MRSTSKVQFTAHGKHKVNNVSNQKWKATNQQIDENMKG